LPDIGKSSLRKLSLRRRLSHWFDDDASHSNRAAHYFNLFLAVLIVVNVATVILETVGPIRDRYALAFSIAEHAATAIFSMEYVLRLWTVVDLRDPKFVHPLWGRLRYMRSFFALIDLVAVLPALLGFLGAGDLRVLRLVRLHAVLFVCRFRSHRRRDPFKPDRNGSGRLRLRRLHAGAVLSGILGLHPAGSAREACGLISRTTTPESLPVPPWPHGSRRAPDSASAARKTRSSP
jgi:hypothetical protein